MGLDLFHLIPALSTDPDVWDYIPIEDIGSENYVAQHRQLVVTPPEQGINALYFKSIGYQRKGMNKMFYEDFLNNKAYFRLSDVLKAYAYLEAGSDYSLADQQKEFQTAFINNFKEGESILYASW